jgi:hypothetical protein
MLKSIIAINKRKEYTRQWFKKHPGYSSEQGRRWKLDHPGRNTLYQKQYRKDHPKVSRCWRATQRAIISGKLIKQPCLFCGSLKVQAHHPDYSKPLDIVWLCKSCHKRLHAVLLKTKGELTC